MKKGAPIMAPPCCRLCRSDCAAALLTFRARAAIVAAAATFTAITSATAATPPTALAAIFAFAAGFTAILLALEGLSALGTRLLIPGTAVVASVSALSALAAASAATASIIALALIALPPGITGGAARLGCCGFIGTAEESFQPADESTGLFLRLGSGCRRLVRFTGTRLEFPLVTPRLTRFEATRFTRIAAALAGLPGFPRFIGTAFVATFSAALAATCTAFPSLARGLECPTLVGILAGCGLGRWRAGGTVRLPSQGGAPRV